MACTFGLHAADQDQLALILQRLDTLQQRLSGLHEGSGETRLPGGVWGSAP
jgi:hypothetical protein